MLCCRSWFVTGWGLACTRESWYMAVPWSCNPTRFSLSSQADQYVRQKKDMQLGSGMVKVNVSIIIWIMNPRDHQRLIDWLDPIVLGILSPNSIVTPWWFTHPITLDAPNFSITDQKVEIDSRVPTSWPKQKIDTNLSHVNPISLPKGNREQGWVAQFYAEMWVVYGKKSSHRGATQTTMQIVTI